MLAFDTETTGLLRPSETALHLQPFMTEIYVCKFNDKFEIYDEFETLVKPPYPIPPEITKITGITDNDLKDAPAFIEIYDELSDFFLGETELYAHNCTFDAGVLMYELKRHDLEFKFPWPKKHICTVEASLPIKNKRMKLGDLHLLATGKELKNAHRAKNDVVGMVKCIKWLKENGFV